MKKKITPESLEHLRRIMRSDYDAELSDKELAELAQSVIRLHRTALKFRMRRKSIERLLILFPEGYEVPDYQGRCEVCGSYPSQDFHWIDKTGVKCAPCYRSFRRRAVPQVAATDRDSWYSDEEIQEFFLIKPKKINRLIEKRILVAREIKGSGFRLFMCADNPTFLPPRSTLRIATENSDGKKWYEVFDPWRSLEGFEILEWSGLPRINPSEN